MHAVPPVGLGEKLRLKLSAGLILGVIYWHLHSLIYETSSISFTLSLKAKGRASVNSEMESDGWYPWTFLLLWNDLEPLVQNWCATQTFLDQVHVANWHGPCLFRCLIKRYFFFDVIHSYFGLANHFSTNRKINNQNAGYSSGYFTTPDISQLARTISFGTPVPL